MAMTQECSVHSELRQGGGLPTKTTAIGRWPQFHSVAIRQVTERQVEREATGAAPRNWQPKESVNDLELRVSLKAGHASNNRPRGGLS